MVVMVELVAKEEPFSKITTAFAQYDWGTQANEANEASIDTQEETFHLNRLSNMLRQ